jgi:hypothetical protein
MFHRLFKVSNSNENFMKKLVYIRETGDLNGLDRNTLGKNYKRNERATRIGNLTSSSENDDQDQEKPNFCWVDLLWKYDEKYQKKIK